MVNYSGNCPHFNMGVSLILVAPTLYECRRNDCYDTWNFFGFRFAVVTGWETENKYRVRNTLGQQVYFAAERKKLLVCIFMNIISATPIGLGMQNKFNINNHG